MASHLDMCTAVPQVPGGEVPVACFMEMDREGGASARSQATGGQLPGTYNSGPAGGDSWAVYTVDGGFIKQQAVMFPPPPAFKFEAVRFEAAAHPCQ